MSDIKEEYIKKILEIKLRDKKCDNIIVYSTEGLDNITKYFLKLKDAFNLKNVIFFDNSYQRLYNFFKTNPSREEIKNFVTKYPEIDGKAHTEMIFINNNDDHAGFFNKITDEYEELFKIYRKYNIQMNKKYFDLMYDKSLLSLIDLPNQSWADKVYSTGDLDELWSLINKTIPSTSAFFDEIERMKEIRKYLEMSKIKNLYFYTDLGTNFKIGLSNYASWFSQPEYSNGKECFYNIPSYEIYTSPDYHSAEGTIIVKKPSAVGGIKITEARLKFEQGKCVQCESNNERWNRVVMNKQNKLHRIGEIALVSMDNPISRLNQIFNAILFDENSGCHLALGNSIRETINLSDDLIEKNGLNYYGFNESHFHQDLVFGNNSITVRADTKNKQKVLLMENGIWKI